MRAIVQRVKGASVAVNHGTVGSIEKGLLVYLGVHTTDEKFDADYLLDKILGLRIFEDDSGKMNLSVVQTGGGLLIVSQFTLFGDCRKGKRPSFSEAAGPQQARDLYEYFVSKCRETGVETETGTFREMMLVASINEGPVTILLDSRKLF